MAQDTRQRLVFSMVGPVVVYTDGCCRGNNNPSVASTASIGVVAFDGNDKKLFQVAVVLGDATNNEAEYSAIIYALMNCAYLKPVPITIRSDSRLCVSHINGDYKCKAKNLIPMLNLINAHRQMFSDLKFEWIPREQNLADAVANEILDE